MSRKLSEEERAKLLNTVSKFHEVFGEEGELKKALWPLVVAAAGSDYFTDMDGGERQNILIAFDETLEFVAAALGLLAEDIRRHRKAIKPAAHY